MARSTRYLLDAVRADLRTRFPALEAWQVSLPGKKDFVTREGIRVAPATELLGRLA